MHHICIERPPRADHGRASIGSNPIPQLPLAAYARAGTRMCAPGIDPGAGKTNDGRTFHA
jgi:hypothetical protein